MRNLLIPALALIIGYPAMASDEQQNWKHRSRQNQRPDIHQGYGSYERRDWGHSRGHHGRPWYPEREVVVERPAPIHVHPLPLPPPPPPLSLHLWFGF